MSGSGAGVACVNDLLTNDPANARYGARAVYRPNATGNWSAPVLVGDDAVVNDQWRSCTTAIGEDGSAAVVVTRVVATVEPTNVEVVALIRPASGNWLAPFVVSGAGRLAEAPSAFFDATGNLTVAWRERWRNVDNNSASDDRSTLKVRRWTASNQVWGATVDPAGAEGQITRNLFAPRLAGNSSGRAVLAWQEGVTVHVSDRASSSAGFSAPVPLVTLGAGEAAFPQKVAVAPDGTAFVGYWHNGNPSSNDSAGLARKPLAGAWSTKLVGPKGGSGNFGEIALLGNDAFGVLLAGKGGNTHLQAVRWRAGATQPDAERDLISPSPVEIDIPRAVADQEGGLVVSYGEGAERTPKLVPYDGSPPRAVAITVPAKAVAGESVALQANFADRWSAIGGVKWSFGDGTSGDGADVGHTWAKSGIYTVTVEGRDTLGNTRVVEKTITVDAGDRVGPKVTLLLPRCGARKGKACRAYRQTRKAWGVLRGKANDPSGVAKVRVSVARKTGKRFDVLKGKKFRSGKTAKQARKTFVNAKLKGNTWRLRLPRKLKPGRYTIRVVATDKTGNTSKPKVRTLRLR